MTTKELARRLLDLPDLPVATHANNHTDTYGPIRIGLMKYAGQYYVLIGNMEPRHVEELFV